MEESFPRGRTRIDDDAEASKENSKKKVKAVAKKRDSSDLLFGATPAKKDEATPNNTNKRQKKSSAVSVNKTSLMPLGGGGVMAVSAGRKDGKDVSDQHHHHKKEQLVIESLGFGKLNPGFQMLSIVREVHDDLAVFSLPNHWTGFMLRDKTWACTDMLQVGQMVSVTIVKAIQEQTKGGNPRRRIQVSCMPSKVNSVFAHGEKAKADSILRGQVKTIEDHGLLVDLGFSQLGFLSFDDIEGEYYLTEEEEDDTKDNPQKQKAEHILGEGRLLDFVVKTTAGSKTCNPVLKLSLKSRKSLCQQFTLPDQLTSLYMIQPGQLVNMSVEATAKNGLCVAFAKGAYRGSIESQHLGSFFVPKTRGEPDAWKDVFEKNPGAPARIIAVDVPSKIVRLSLMDHLMHLRMPPKRPEVGAVFEDAVVVRCDAGVGALLALPEQISMEDSKKLGSVHKPVSKEEEYLEGQKMQVAYVHISKSMDQTSGKKKEMESKFTRDFAPSTKHKIRILGSSNLIEGFSSATAAPSAVNAHVFQHSDLVTGKVYKQVPIIGHPPSGGILVDFGHGVKGLIPVAHLFDHTSTSDYRAQVMKVKYAKGAKVDVRVIKVDQEKQKCLVTAKKSLINTKHLLTDYSDIQIGQLGTGCVTKITEKGLHVSFFNDVFGFVPSKSLRQHTLDETYNVGDVIECQVASIKQGLKKRRNGEVAWDLILTIASDESEDTPMDIEKENSALEIAVGKAFPSKSIRVLQMKHSREKNGIIIPGFALVEVPTKHLVKKFDGGYMPKTIECKLTFDQLMDDYSDHLDSTTSLDEMAMEKLKKFSDDCMVLSAPPSKTVAEYKSGTGKYIFLTLRPDLIKASSEGEKETILPKPTDRLFAGALVKGYVVGVNESFGAFVKFLDNLTGLVPKTDGGLDLPLYGSVTTRVVAIDSNESPPKILLSTKLSGNLSKQGSKARRLGVPPVGTKIREVEVEKAGCSVAIVKILDDADFASKPHLHFTIAAVAADDISVPKQKKSVNSKVPKSHPFRNWRKGTKVSDLVVVSSRVHGDEAEVHLCSPSKAFELKNVSFEKGDKASGIIREIDLKKSCIIVDLSPSVCGVISIMDCSRSLDILRNVKDHFVPGQKVSGTALSKINHGVVPLTLLPKVQHLTNGSVVVGRINRHSGSEFGPSISIDLPGSRTGTCCITELTDKKQWTNFPLGNPLKADRGLKANQDGSDDDSDDEEMDIEENFGSFPHGQIVKCFVLRGGKKGDIELSCRESRIEGNRKDDPLPKAGEIVPAYVAETNAKGCFLKLAWNVQGRVILKELTEGYLPDPAAAFPTGRLVMAKVKESSKKAGASRLFDLDLREASLGDASKKVTFEDIKEGEKYKGTIIRVENYGAFVRIDNSTVSGLVHKSQCSENFVSDVSSLYDSGDVVKIIVIKKDSEKKQLGFSMKASHFADDDDSSSESSGEDSDEEMEVEDNDDVEMKDSAKVSDDSSTGSSSSSDDDDSDSEDEKMDQKDEVKGGLDTNVGFDWSGKNLVGELEGASKTAEADDSSSDDDSDSSDSEDEDENDQERSSRRSKKTQAARRREEQATSQREAALADGTADENPETAADFERLLASDPNDSALWIKFMAYYLTLADFDAARKVAKKALSRIEFREESEKMNVWCALLTMEVKYGSSDSVQEALSDACKQVNPKHVHLRLCEILKKEGTAAHIDQSEAIFKKMVKKFKSKKTVWIAYAKFLLENGRPDDAVDLTRRAIKSLAQYKHVWFMSQFGLALYENEHLEKARSVFEGLLRGNPKRADLLNLFIDQEVKHGEMLIVRQFCKRVADVANPDRLMKMTDKQMKKFFKKWFTVEHAHGSEEDCDFVKATAKRFVESTSKENK